MAHISEVVGQLVDIVINKYSIEDPYSPTVKYACLAAGPTPIADSPAMQLPLLSLVQQVALNILAAITTMDPVETPPLPTPAIVLPTLSSLAI